MKPKCRMLMETPVHKDGVWNLQNETTKEMTAQVRSFSQHHVRVCRDRKCHPHTSASLCPPSLHHYQHDTTRHTYPLLTHMMPTHMNDTVAKTRRSCAWTSPP